MSSDTYDEAQAEGALLRALGAEIRKRRRALGLTQQELADRMAITRVRVSELERGLVNMRVLTLKRVADALAISPRDLLT